ncbi:MAG: sigma-70 family RNA polymerase sigma factor [Chloroflexi bacterium]|nr:sigma-70 family RNA polymerase sigma factor [Chloroflexota bacterium]
MRGDQAAWETLVRNYARLVYAVIRRCGIDGEEAADLFQDVWLAAWDGLPSLRDERGLAGWLATIAARQAQRAIRRRARGTERNGEAFEGEALLATDPDPLPDDAVIDRERDAALRAAVASLSDRDRQLVHAFFYDPASPSYAQIAERLGVSPETVGPLRTRCLRRLRSALRASPTLTDTQRPGRPG